MANKIPEQGSAGDSLDGERKTMGCDKGTCRWLREAGRAPALLQHPSKGRGIIWRGVWKKEKD